MHCDSNLAQYFTDATATIGLKLKQARILNLAQLMTSLTSRETSG